MPLKNSEAEVAEIIHHTFSDISCNLDSSHSIYRYAISQFVGRQLIINDSIAHRVVLVNTKNKVIIISLPQYHLDIATGKKSLVGLLDNNCLRTTPVVLVGNFIRGILTLAPTNPDITNQPPIGATSIITILNNIFLYQVPIILPLFSNHKVKKDTIKDKEVCELLYTYYPIGKL